MLSLNGYEIDDKNVAIPENRAEIEALGFDAVPVVAVEGKAFEAFPDEVIIRNLGLEAAPVSLEQQRAQMALAVRVLESTRNVVAALPDSCWGEPVSDLRNRTLGHFAWHLFRFAEIMMETADEKILPWDKLQECAETPYWTEAGRFPTFAAISSYARKVTDRFASWTPTLSEAALAEEMDTCWGRISLRSLLSYIVRHTGVHLRQLLQRVREIKPEACSLVPEEVLAKIPAPSVLW